ncbi:hypothetical protein [Streptomyces virginiae]|uniref:hypothetical protein n=1 Tax=Streptomyces virginiae TaxID=1961 RepID=UPI00224EA09F|nr:hypothetical protein [Streptomyces virginiae]MCX4721903.1 hypothetical protein [Streptomyces virginiae]MCX5276822.1 hypothetical protein [Streptomyces virginiae]
MAGKIGKFVAAAAAAAALVTLAGSPASAGSTAYNQRSVWLNGHPSVNDDQACVTRTIWLKSTDYTWKMYLDGGHRTREVYLEAGTYYWADCIVSLDGAYHQYSRLSKDDGSEPAYINFDRGPHPKGTFIFGSSLLPFDQ